MVLCNWSVGSNPGHDTCSVFLRNMLYYNCLLLPRGINGYLREYRSILCLKYWCDRWRFILKRLSQLVAVFITCHFLLIVVSSKPTSEFTGYILNNLGLNKDKLTSIEIKCCMFFKGSGYLCRTKKQCPQTYTKLSLFKDNNSRKLLWKY